MNPSIVLLHKKALSSWVFADPRRWHLFCYLLMRADEKGYVEVSIRDYCKQYGQERSYVSRLLKMMEDEGICESIVSQKRTIIFLCNYARYNGSGNKSEPIMSQNVANNVNISANTERKKSSPHTPFKEEKENVGTEVATLQKKEKKAADAKISLSPDVAAAAVTPTAAPPPVPVAAAVAPTAAAVTPTAAQPPVPAAAAVTPIAAAVVPTAAPPPVPAVAAAVVVPAGTLDERRKRFWADCCHCHALHREWPAEAVKSFFLFWTQLTQGGQLFKFEAETSWGISHRMASYIRQGRWLDEVAAAKLERIRNGGGGSRRGKPAVSELERRRYEAANAEAEAVYDRYFNERNNP